MVPSYSGTPCLLAPLAGFFQSFAPVASPIKLATPTGALSGKSVHVIVPTVVLMMATGFAAVCVAVPGLAAVPDFAGADWLIIPVCASPTVAASKIVPTIKSALRMSVPCSENVALQREATLHCTIAEGAIHRRGVGKLIPRNYLAGA